MPARGTADRAPTTTTTSPSSGLITAPKGVTTRLELRGSHRIVAGSTRRGNLVVRNRTGSPIDLTVLAANHCRPMFAVVLTNKSHPPTVAFPMVCGLSPFTLAPGTNRLPFRVSASVPPGKYLAVLVGRELALPAPKPVEMTVVKR